MVHFWFFVQQYLVDRCEFYCLSWCS